MDWAGAFSLNYMSLINDIRVVINVKVAFCSLRSNEGFS